MIYKAGKHTGVENDKFIHFNLSAGTYATDEFNAKIKVAISQQRQDWEPPQIKDLKKLVVPKHYTFMADNTNFIALVVQDNYLEKTTLIRSTLSPGSNEVFLGTSPLILLSLHCKRINKVKSKLDGQPSNLLARMHF